MFFHSFEFACFLTVVSIFIFCFRVSNVQKFILVAASLFFYSWANSQYIWLLLYSTCLDFVLAQKIHVAEGNRRKNLLILSLVGNLGLLCFFKYLGFFNALLLAFGGAWKLDFDLILPIGISFYTFQTMSYSIDVYRGHLKPCRRIWDFAVYVTFFPQLIAGPIVRAKEFLPQLEKGIKFCPDNIRRGLELFVLGLFKKSMGDVLHRASEEISYFSGDYGGLWILFSVYAWAFYIYLDFAGYSDMAIGLARMFGLKLPENFRFPFLASSFSDLWKRWHITLSTWMRDYLYIPLGGNRCSKKRQGFNLMTTMTLSGLWHGASLPFLLWGFLHGLLLFFERSFIWRWIARSRLLSTVFVFHCMAFLFVFFRPLQTRDGLGVHVLRDYGRIFLKMFSETKGEMRSNIGLGLYVMGFTVIIHVLAYRNENFAEKWMENTYLRTAALFVGFLLALIFVGHTANVYFRF